MHKLIEFYKRSRKSSRDLENLHIRGLLYFKSSTFAFLLAFVLLVPFIIIAYNVFSLYAAMTWQYKVMVFSSVVAVVIYLGLVNFLNILLLKRYLPENAELQNIRSSDIFIAETINPYMIGFGIIMFFIL
jgi:membrane protein YdbS with pleckstrin-like domain